MTKAEIRDGRLVIEFSAVERLFTWRHRVEMPINAIRQVQRMHTVRGVRTGIEVLGVGKIGYWGRRLVSVRRGQTAVRIVADGHREIIVSVPEPVITALEAVTG